VLGACCFPFVRGHRMACASKFCKATRLPFHAAWRKKPINATVTHHLTMWKHPVQAGTVVVLSRATLSSKSRKYRYVARGNGERRCLTLLHVAPARRVDSEGPPGFVQAHFGIRCAGAQPTGNEGAHQVCHLCVDGQHHFVLWIHGQDSARVAHPYRGSSSCTGGPHR